jgi:hypothetical protein
METNIKNLLKRLSFLVGKPSGDRELDLAARKEHSSSILLFTVKVPCSTEHKSTREEIEYAKFNSIPSDSSNQEHTKLLPTLVRSSLP